jgi:hypothetical protein
VADVAGEVLVGCGQHIVNIAMLALYFPLFVERLLRHLGGEDVLVPKRFALLLMLGNSRQQLLRVRERELGSLRLVLDTEKSCANQTGAQNRRGAWLHAGWPLRGEQGWIRCTRVKWPPFRRPFVQVVAANRSYS